MPLMAFDERGWIPKLHLYSSDEAATVAVHDPPVVTMKRCTLRRSESLPISFTEKKRHFKTTDCQNKTRRLFSNNSWTTKVESSVDKPQDRKRTCSPLAYKRRYSKREDSRDGFILGGTIMIGTSSQGFLERKEERKTSRPETRTMIRATFYWVSHSSTKRPTDNTTTCLWDQTLSVYLSESLCLMYSL